MVLFSISLGIICDGGICTQWPSFASCESDLVQPFPLADFTVVIFSVVVLAVVLAVVVIVFKEEVLEAAVRRESHCRNAQAREGSLESAPPAEETRVSPSLTVGVLRLAHYSRADPIGQNLSLRSFSRGNMGGKGQLFGGLTIAPMDRSEASWQPP